MTASTIPLVGVPQFELTIGNSAVSPQLKADIASVSVEEEVGVPARLEFSINLWDGLRQKLKEDYVSQFALGTPVELAIGINQVSPIFTGEVTALEPEFGGVDRGDSLKVQAYNRLYRLQFGTYQRTFQNVKYSEIASLIAGEIGLSDSVDDTGVKQRLVTQNNVSNLVFLTTLAQSDLANFEVFVEDKTLYFRESQENQSPAVTLAYRRDLIEFTPRQRAVPEGASVEVRGWDIQNKTLILGRAGAGDEVSKMGGQQTGAEVSASAFSSSSSTRTVTSPTVVDASEAERVARAWYNRQQSNFIEAQGTSAGSPLIRAGKTIEINGIGQSFSGIYYVVSATHNFGPTGYRTQFTATRNAI